MRKRNHLNPLSLLIDPANKLIRPNYVICPTGCGGLAAPDFVAGCEGDVRVGGIEGIIWMDCELTIDDWTNETLWQAARDAGQISLSPAGLIDKPVTDTTVVDLDSCGTQGITSEQHILNVTWRYVDNTAYTDFDYHNQLRDNFRKYKIGWIDCSGLVYLNPDIDTALKDPGFDWWWTQWAHVTPQTNLELQEYQAILNFRRRTIVKGREMPFLKAILTS